MPLGRDAVALLLEVLECPQPLLSGATMALRPGEAAPLVAAGLLVRHGHEDVASLPYGEEDHPTAVFAWGNPSAPAAFDPTSGIVHIAPEQLVVWAASMPTFLRAISAELGLFAWQSPAPLVEGLLWELGDTRVGRGAQRTPVWFCRRLWDPTVRRQVEQVTAARPYPRRRVLFTSSRPGRVRDVSVPNATVVPILDVLRDPGDLVISPEILGARISGVPVPGARQPIHLSEDGKTLTILDEEPIYFKSEEQIEVIRKLVDAHRQGKRLRARDLTGHGTLRRFLGGEKWARLKPYLKSRAGLWAFQV